VFRAGDRIGPYILISRLGKGSFGVVWLAERRTFITTQFALKLPKDEDINLDAIKQEATIWTQATGHTNVVPIIEADIYDNQVVIVSEYAPDGSLREWLGKHGGRSPSIEASLDMMVGILCGLRHLHQRRIIHRDLKPDNVLLQGETPRIADFGMAHVLKSSSQSDFIKGTPTYMAPEALQAKRTEQTDLWSAGVMLYQLIAGYLPFQQKDIPSLMWAISNFEPEPLPDSVPSPLRSVIARSLEKGTDKRYKSASDFLAALRNTALSLGAKANDVPILSISDAETCDESTIIAPRKEGIGREKPQSVRMSEGVPQVGSVMVTSQGRSIALLHENGSRGLEEILEELREQTGDAPLLDFETHYSLGLAYKDMLDEYKDMDFLDKAIREFQMAFRAAGPEHLEGDRIHCCNMLGVCFKRKQMLKEAIIWFGRGLRVTNRLEDEYQALRFEIALCYEDLGEFDQAIEVFLEVYGRDVNYRRVGRKIKELQAARDYAMAEEEDVV
jgi:serine/threonine protein kinase